MLRDFRVFMSINIPISGSFKATKEEIISIKKQIEATLNDIEHCRNVLFSAKTNTANGAYRRDF